MKINIMGPNGPIEVGDVASFTTKHRFENEACIPSAKIQCPKCNETFFAATFKAEVKCGGCGTLLKRVERQNGY